MSKNKKYIQTYLDYGNLSYPIDVFTNHTTAEGRDNDKIIFDLTSLKFVLPPSVYINIYRELMSIMPEEVLLYGRVDNKLELFLSRGKKYDDVSIYPRVGVGKNIISVIIFHILEIIRTLINQKWSIKPPNTSTTNTTSSGISSSPKLPTENIALQEEINEEKTTEQVVKQKKAKDNNQFRLSELKTEMSQLLFLKSIISPIDFEQNINISQLILKKQNEINKQNFYIVENNLNNLDIFEDLFEQSFIEINHTYNDVYSQPDSPIDFFTPNGKKSGLSEELNEIIRTQQFKEWFGDWELAYLYRDTDAVEIDCSKVLTENYEPRVVWHGTGKEFSYFRFDNFPAAYFAVKREYSQWFADAQAGEDGYTIPFFLNIKNPLDLTMFKSKEVSTKDFFDYLYIKTGLDTEQLGVNPIFLEPDFPNQKIWIFIRNNAKMLKVIADSNVYDGIHFYETNPNVAEGETAHETEAYITFFENQAKIAAPNRGLLLLASLKSFLLKSGGKI
jgi:hypothetical protein